MAEALDRASRVKADVVVITRGGGSSEDRLTFNLEAVVRAILRSPHPVITALGHLKYRHLADEVADLSLPTPHAAVPPSISERNGRGHSSCWSACTPRCAGVTGSVLAGKTQSVRFADVALERSVEGLLNRRLEQMRGFERLLSINAAPRPVSEHGGSASSGSATGALARSSERLQPLSWLSRRGAWNVRRHRWTVEDPTRPLARGYAIVTKAGVAVHDVAVLAYGDVVTARVAHGTFDARVESVHAE